MNTDDAFLFRAEKSPITGVCARFSIDSDQPGTPDDDLQL